MQKHILDDHGETFFNITKYKCDKCDSTTKRKLYVCTNLRNNVEEDSAEKKINALEDSGLVDHATEDVNDTLQNTSNILHTSIILKLLFTLQNSLQLQLICKYLFNGQERTGLNKNLQQFQQEKA